MKKKHMITALVIGLITVGTAGISYASGLAEPSMNRSQQRYESRESVPNVQETDNNNWSMRKGNHCHDDQEGQRKHHAKQGGMRRQHMSEQNHPTEQWSSDSKN